jgi:hypothetical protein
VPVRWRKSRGGGLNCWRRVLQRGDDPSPIKPGPHCPSRLALRLPAAALNMRRSRLVRGRLRVPFKDYERRSVPTDLSEQSDHQSGCFGPQHGLTPEQARMAQQCFTRVLERRQREGLPWTGPWLAAIIAGVVSAVKGGRVANSAWGWKLHGRRGGLVMSQHASHHLRAISSLGVRASLIARERRKAAGNNPSAEFSRA